MSRTAQPLMRPSAKIFRRLLPAESCRLLDAVVSASEGRGESLWLVGGALRDCAAGLPLRDVDVSVDGDGLELAAAVAKLLGGEMSQFPRFGTATVRLGDHELDVSSLRRELYPRPGALPAVEIGATVEEDLARRDFSVNAVALGLAGPRRGEIIDPFGGLEDLARHRLRLLHRHSLVDDPTRLWRGARYAARLHLRPTAETALLITAGKRWLHRVSGRRLWVEFCRGAEESRVWTMLRLLDEWGVLTATAPGFVLASQAAAALRHRSGPHQPSLVLAVILAPLSEREDVLNRLTPPNEARRAVAEACRLLALPNATPRLLECVKESGLSARTAALWLDPQRQRPLQRALQRWQRTRSPLGASALLRLGVSQGSELGLMLRCLRRQRYLGTLRNASEARRFVRSALREEAVDG